MEDEFKPKQKPVFKNVEEELEYFETERANQWIKSITISVNLFIEEHNKTVCTPQEYHANKKREMMLPTLRESELERLVIEKYPMMILKRNEAYIEVGKKIKQDNEKK